MLFHTWPFLIFMLVVLPVYYALRRTSLWIPWLLAASYFFYGWWNPYYLLLVVYSTALDYLLVAFMDHCPPAGAGGRVEWKRGPTDPWLRCSAVVALGLALSFAGFSFVAGSWRAAVLLLAALVFLMALGAWLASRRIWLIISLVNNLTLLLFFKYARFVVENVNALFAAGHLRLHLADPSMLMPHGLAYVLPVGISFFTFQSMSYTIDFYLGRAERERDFLRFATFVCFFPQLMAGPIERARQMLPQFKQPPPVSVAHVTDGLSLFLTGLFKKVALANYLAPFVDKVYDNPDACDATSLTLATVAFAWQIFFDFSGYTDMARGIAKVLGFELMLNFNNPYMAAGLGEFWSRWHISLSTWFRDYLYIPLGGNRGGAAQTYRNLLIVFLVSGIWHGAAWTYAIWGLLHAAGVLLTRELERSTFYREKVPRLAKQAWVFCYVCFAWIFFRAASVADAWLIVRRIGGAAWKTPQIPALMLALVVAVWTYQWLYESRFRSALAWPPLRVACAVGMMLYLGFCTSGGQAFIYFQF